MTLGILPATEEGNNWTVIVFRCPRKNWTEILHGLFSELDRHKVSLIPHYTIRYFDLKTDSLIISLRVLARKEDEEIVRSKTAAFMKDYDFQIDPKKGERFYEFHQWIGKGSRNDHWTKERCHILSKISRFILEITKSDTSKEDKEEWAHLFANMTAMFDLLKIYQSPETILNPEPDQYRVLKYF